MDLISELKPIYPITPQLGSFAKYEKYFGDGISLTNRTSLSTLKNTPSTSTLGLSYTPFPLLSVKGQTSRGDSHDSLMGLELTYRFGVPLSQQLDTNKVNLMRTQAGNRYDFVDRNYNIVMQYRKQELFTISLPESLSAEAASSLRVTATVHKAKYDLKNIKWSAPELTARGGSIQVTSPVTINLTLPTPVFSEKTNEPQRYKLTAVGTDREGNQSNTAVMWVNVKPSQETITSLTLSPDSIITANNIDTYHATATIQNEKGEPLSHKDVTFTVNGFTDNKGVILSAGSGDAGESVTVTTAANGRAQITIKSKVAGQGELRATMKNGSLSSIPLHFAVDTRSAKIATLVVTKNNAVTNGTAQNSVKARVTDANNNPLPNVAVVFTPTNGGLPSTGTVTTNAHGEADFALSNTTAGTTTVTAEVNGTSQTVEVTFVAEASSATLPNENLTVVTNNAVANGTAQNSVKARVTDANNNPLPNVAVVFTPTNGGLPSTQTVTTNAHGEADFALSNTRAGTTIVTAEVNGTSQTVEVTFVGEEEAPDSINTQVNAYTFTQTSVEGTFPTTGFTGATFTIVPKDSKSTTDYIWSANASWVSVTNGVVKFTGTGTGSKVTITGAPSSGQGKTIKYSFKLKSWFINNGSPAISWSNANTYCLSQSGYRIPTIEQLTNNSSSGSGPGNQSRAANAGLWSEWGNLNNYDGGFTVHSYWSSEQRSDGQYYRVYLSNGLIYGDYVDGGEINGVCRKGL
ncbi:TPA: Ig-like domain-containing protein [Providencia alcalifaciens]|uniref:Ig-like domain-containing protein n=1 Tax=Providencia sp. JUb39 TaxID=2724165 RepID=UPI00164D7B9E|nr:Ig-like domain-containing protein [Providencia sp. JUb39]MBC5792375.1 Ig-like domain-containing protein [Providencia sp. JUb39]